MILKESKKMIVGSSFFTKGKGTEEEKQVFKIEYVNWKKDGTYTGSDGQVHDQLKKVIDFIFVDSSVFDKDKNFVGKSNSEICQELQGKSVVISTKIE